MLWAGQNRGADPEYRHLWLVLERYSRECFYSASRHHRPADWLGLGVLRAELPLERVVQAVGRSLWESKNPFSSVTVQGCELDLLHASPAMVKLCFYRDCN